MRLCLPPGTCFQMGKAIEITFRQIFFFNNLPCPVTLFFAHFRLLVHYMLKLINSNTIRQEQDGLQCMRISVAVGTAIEKQIHVRIREVFHGHAVYFSSIGGRPAIFHGRLIFTEIYLKSMSHFMGQYVNIG